MSAFDQTSNREKSGISENQTSPALNADLSNHLLAESSARATKPGTAAQKHLPSVEVLNTNPDNAGWKDVAEKTDLALRKSFYSKPMDRFFTTFPDPKHDIASAWDMGQVMEATLSTASILPDGSKSGEIQEDLRALNHYWDGHSNPPGFDSTYGPKGDKYYDDDAWMGIALMDAYKQKPDQDNLNRAKQVFEFDKFGAQGTDKFAHPGGVLWSQEAGNFYRAAVSTAGAAQLGLELYQQTHDKQYLDFATKQFDWVNDNLRAPNGLYDDGMDKDGTLHKDQYTYNQGLMLGDSTLLYQSTGDPKYLQQAQEIAKASLQAFGENSGTPFAKQMTFFNAVFFKNLMMLDSVAPDPAYRKALADYAGELQKRIDPKTNLVKADGKNTLLEQSSAVQVFALAHEYPPA